MPAPSTQKPAAPRQQHRTSWMSANRNSVALVSALTILVVGYLVLIHPLVLELLPNGSLDPKPRQDELGLRQDRLAQLEALERQYADIPQSDLQKLSRFLPAEPDVPSIVTALEDISATAGMQLLAVDSNPRKDAVPGLPNIGSTDIAVSVAGGDYLRLVSFLRGVESNLRLFDVTALAFQASSGVFAINLRAYHVLER